MKRRPRSPKSFFYDKPSKPHMYILCTHVTYQIVVLVSHRILTSTYDFRLRIYSSFTNLNTWHRKLYRCTGKVKVSDCSSTKSLVTTTSNNEVFRDNICNMWWCRSRHLQFAKYIFILEISFVFKCGNNSNWISAYIVHLFR